MDFLAGIFASMMSKLVSWLVSKGLEWYHGREQKAATEDDINNKLVKFKEAYKEAFNGEPVTPEQREKLKGSIRDFIRGVDTNGGM